LTIPNTRPPWPSAWAIWTSHRMCWSTMC